MIVCASERLTIRHLTLSDADFILQLFNDPYFIEYIGDKKVRTIDEAIEHLKNGPLLSYKDNGFGMNLVVLPDSNVAIGVCGLVKRDEFEHPDLGYALLPQYYSQGFAFEASTAVLNNGHKSHHLAIISAITAANNSASINLLTRLGFVAKGKITFKGKDDNIYEHQL